ncbi:MAG: hypothetical protein Q4G27_04635 [Flavobacteriaceae bacterium]|nr:hypothetical protein [Flavobacteriaceae bacterium]
MRDIPTFYVLLLCLLMGACNSKTDSVNSSPSLTPYQKSVIESQEKVIVPEVLEVDLQSLAQDYEKFVNESYHLLENYDINSTEFEAKKQEFLNDSEIYIRKMEYFQDRYQPRDIEKIRKYIQDKKEEFNNFSKKESLKKK